MKRFIRFDENNVSKVIVKYSFILVCAIALLLLLIYTPKYYLEYKKNIESTSEHLNELFRERIKFEVEEMVKNTQYRSDVHRNYVMYKFDNETFLFRDELNGYLKNRSENNDRILRSFISSYSVKDTLKYYFISYSDKILLRTNDSLLSVQKPEFGPEGVRSKIDSILQKTDKSRDNIIKIKYSDKNELYCGLVFPEKNLERGLKEIVYQEIKKANIKGSQEYIFVYEILKYEGGKGFARMLINPNRPDLTGSLIDDDYKDAQGFEFRKEFMKQIRINNEAFVSYIYKDPQTGENDLKTSYFKYYPEFKWVFAQGYYRSQISQIIAEDVARYKNDFIFRIILIISLIVFSLTLYYFLFRHFSRRVQETILRYRSGLKKKNKLLLKEIELSNAKQKELSEFSDYISQIYESVPVGIVLIDASSKIIEKINNSGLETLGYNKEDIIGTKCHLSFCPALAGKCPIIDEKKDIDNSERTIVDKYGNDIPVFKKACKISIKGKNYILESFIDIRKIKEAEKKLIELKE
ncbi:MAG: cache domain-containing protein, partial [Candidatus Delongbacteria bacterium]